MENKLHYFKHLGVLFIALIGGLVLQLMHLSVLDEMEFLLRNVTAIVLVPTVILQLFFIRRKALFTSVLALLLIGTIVWINAIAKDAPYLELIIAFSVPWYWFLGGCASVGDELFQPKQYLEYIKDTGKWIIIAGLLGVAFMLLFVGSMALASTIIGDVNETFIEHTLKWILPSIPVFAVYIQRMHPTILKDVAFIIASIFSPITLVVLILQCILLMTNLNEIMESRAFLLVFNFVLIGVLALIAFVGLELEKRKSSFQVNVLIGLSSMAILINAFAFYCIVYRINTWGWSANKLSIVGTNIILFVHFCWIVYSLFRGKDKEDKQRLLKNTLSGYLLIYFIWIFFVVFVLPLILN